MKVLVLNPPTEQTENILRDLVYGCWCKGKRIGGAKSHPLSLLYVATTVKNEGHEVTFLDALAEEKPVSYVKKIISDYDLVIISTSTMSFSEDAFLLKKLKQKNPHLITIIFGSHPTFMPKSALSISSIDIAVRREPEFIIRDLVNSLEKRDNSWKKVKGIGYREGKKIILNEFYPYIKNLDELPFPDRTMLPKGIDYFNPIVKRMPYTTAITGRGCPGKCTFCTVPNFYGAENRYRSANSVIKELEVIQAQGFKEVWFRDETFTAYRERNEKICREMIKRKMDLTWICNARVGMITKEMMRLMKKAGCRMIKFGVESGDQQILNNVKKGITVENTRLNFKWTHEVGIDTHAHTMLGMPGETKETIEKTIKFIKQIDPTTATFGICTPYAGTELFEDLLKKHPEIKKKMGDGSTLNLANLHEKSFFNEYFADVDKKYLNKAVKKAYKAFYVRPSYLLKMLSKIRSRDELKRLTLAGVNVLSFSVERDEE
jgi:anaerobic magnesium-protoporphyrin IX monomethyl ester cyclase